MGELNGTEPLAPFHPLIQQWFRDAVGVPTEVQARAWPRIAAGEHVLVTAPTGSGKTLTAFLWALDRLFTETWLPGQVRVLYVSPLRALNTDIHRNLEVPLAALTAHFAAAGIPVPVVRALTRSGDTPAATRQRMLRQPPEILITTPESLNILLTSKGGRSLLTGLATVILDEIHAVAGSKRGTHLITAVDRLVPLAGGFQRIALSATIRPLETIAAFVGGYEHEHLGDGQDRFHRRPVTIVRAATAKAYDVKVCYPAAAGNELDEEALWPLLVRGMKGRIRRNGSTLLFANSRRLTEKTTRLINDGEAQELAYAHHGSLSREVRAVVEKRLKAGELAAIVATSSLELGIDIGSLDEVILVQTPPSVAAAIQRVGRAGHGVGEVSRASLYPIHPRDFLDAAVVVRAILDQDIEAVAPIEAPLDVLAQVVLSMLVSETWELDSLHSALRTSYPYRNLSRRQLDLVLEMLAGRYADSHIRALKPRISLDRVAGTARARRGTARLLYMSGGTIADRGYFALRHQDSMAKIGELDEEFVWERSVGDTFSLGAQSWQIGRITHNDVLVRPARRGAAMAPFWRADALDRSAFLSTRIGELLAVADQALNDPAFALRLQEEHGFEPAAVSELLDLLARQKTATGGFLPHRHRILMEHVRKAARGGEGDEQVVIIHTFWGGEVNRPFAIALAGAWEERYGYAPELFQENDCLLLKLTDGAQADEIFELVPPEHLEALLRRRLERTGYFGAHFRVNASTALLLPRTSFRSRQPLWISRQRAKQLLEAVGRYGDFPVLVETWRACLQDGFDLESLSARLQEVQSGTITVREVCTDTPSPFAANLVWQQTNQYMYEDDTPSGGRSSGVRPDLLREVVFASQLRPQLSRALVERFRRKVRRIAPGYAPPPEELADWVYEQVLMSSLSWGELLAAVQRDHEVERDVALEEAKSRALWVTLPQAEPAVVALERLPQLLTALGLELEAVTLGALEAPEAPVAKALHNALDDRVATRASSAPEGGDEATLSALIGEQLRFEGPLLPARLGALFGLAPARLQALLEGLQEAQGVVVDALTQDAEAPEVCDAENLEILLRWLRQAARPPFEALDSDYLPLALAAHQGLAPRGDCVEDLQARLEQLLAYPMPAAAWESEILPARLVPYYPAWLDSLMQSSDLLWLGCGKERLTFVFPEELALVEPTAEEEESTEVEIEALFPDRRGHYDLAELATHASLSASRAAQTLWPLAWAGRVASDSFVTVRKGVENKFKAPNSQPATANRRRSRHGSRDRWRAVRPLYGHWRVLDREEEAPLDALDQVERVKGRVRILLERYGVLFRELLTRELPAFRWASVFRALRLMELSGEVLAGHFFTGISGLQFIAHGAYRRLVDGLPDDAIYWLNATDPASPCGLDLEPLKKRFPVRRASTHLVFHGRTLQLVSERQGSVLDIRVPPHHPHLADYLEVLKVLLSRDVLPRKHIAIETINELPAHTSSYLEPLSALFRLTREPAGVKLWKRYR